MTLRLQKGPMFLPPLGQMAQVTACACACPLLHSCGSVFP